MSDERARRVKELFERVLDAPQDERPGLLAQIDEDLRVEVEELLRAEREMADFLEAPALAGLLGPDAAPAVEPGTRIGGFEVVSLLGRGGGGVVYEAIQHEPRRRIALKVRPRRHAGGGERLRAEAATLARLQHPGIAHVYAAGVHETASGGLPWIAMELVEDARDIVRHSDELGLGRRRRLELFAAVCEALHHAHQKGVIHLDVKPGNVLVGPPGRPKVVDFGIAAEVGGDARAFAGTPPYMSPEQLDPRHGGSDVRSDVYGLGVLLHELLSGRLPHDLAGLTPTEAARRVRERAPPLSAAGAPRDLSAIVARATAPDREERYASAAALAADVRRYLQHEPVEAYAGGALYAVRKFVRRRRGVAIGVGVAALAVVAGLIVSLSLLYRSEQARRGEAFQSYVARISAASAALRANDVNEARRQLEQAPDHLRDWEWRHLRARSDMAFDAIDLGDAVRLRSGDMTPDGRLAVVGLLPRVRTVPDSEAAIVRRDGTPVRRWRADGIVWSVAIGGRPAVAAVGTREGALTLVDAETGDERARLEARHGAVIGLAFSPDGELLASGGGDGTIHLWDVQTARRVRALAGHDGERVIALAFGASGRRLYSGGRDDAIRIWDVASGAQVRALTGHTETVEGVAPSPDESRVASVSRDGTVRLWDVATGAELAVGATHTSNVRDVAFGADGAVFVSASWDGTLRVWDGETGEEIGVLRGHEAPVYAVSALDDGSFASFSDDGTTRLWTPDAVDVPIFGEPQDLVAAVNVGPDGKTFAVGANDGSVWLLDVATMQPLLPRAELPHAVTWLGFAGGDRYLGVSEDRKLRSWTWGADGARDMDHDRAPAAVHAAVTRVGSGVVWGAYRVPPGGEVTRWDIGGLQPTKLAEVACLPTAIDRHHATGRIAVGGEGGQVIVLHPDGSRVSSRLHASWVRGLSFDDTGGLLASSSTDGTALLLRSGDLSVVHRLQGHSAAVTDVAFLPGGRRLVTASVDQTVRLWDTERGAQVLVLESGGYPAWCVDVTPDGRHILTGGGAQEDAQSAVRLWSAPRPHEVR